MSNFKQLKSDFKKNYNDAKKKQKPKSNLSCLGCFGLTAAILLLFMMFAMTKVQKEEDAAKIEHQKILKESSISEEQYENIKSVVESVGLEIKHMKRDEFMNDYIEPGDIGFVLNKTDEPGAPMTLLAIKEDKTVQRIVYKGIPLYENNTVIDNATNYTISSEERANYHTLTKEHVKSALTFPETAKFPLIDGFAMSKNQGNVTVQGEVECKNAFGVPIKSNFQVIYNSDSVPTSLIIDGQELLTK